MKIRQQDSQRIELYQSRMMAVIGGLMFVAFSAAFMFIAATYKGEVSTRLFIFLFASCFSAIGILVILFTSEYIIVADRALQTFSVKKTSYISIKYFNYLISDINGVYVATSIQDRKPSKKAVITTKTNDKIEVPINGHSLSFSINGLRIPFGHKDTTMRQLAEFLQVEYKELGFGSVRAIENTFEMVSEEMRNQTTKPL